MLKVYSAYMIGNLELEGNEYNIDFTGKNRAFETQRQRMPLPPSGGRKVSFRFASTPPPRGLRIA